MNLSSTQTSGLIRNAKSTNSAKGVKCVKSSFGVDPIKSATGSLRSLFSSFILDVAYLGHSAMTAMLALLSMRGNAVPAKAVVKVSANAVAEISMAKSTAKWGTTTTHYYTHRCVTRPRSGKQFLEE